jgi:branched-chain amino acid transport system permease protein
LEVLQLLIGGVAQGCVYGLIALGFVLIYKATEQVNFAQGDILMLGAYVALTLIVEAESRGWSIHLSFWLALPLTMAIMAVFGYLLDRVALRPIIGQPQFAVVILTIALGFVFRAAAGAIWSTEPQTLATPFTGKKVVLGGLVLGAESLAIIAGTVILSGVLFAFFRYTRIGVAMQAASQNQLAAYYMGIPVKIIFSMIWAISAAVAAAAGVLLAPIATIDPNMGFIGLKAFAAAVIGGFGSLPGALIAGLMLGAIEPFAAAYGSRAGLPKGVPEVSSYIFMLVVLIVRPQGLFAQIYRKKV